jgi:hypothetical protein
MASADWGATLKIELGLTMKVPGERPGVIRKRQTRADLERAERRGKARKWIATSGADHLSRKVEARLERLESTNWNDALADGEAAGEGGGDDDGEDFEAGSESSEDDGDSDMSEEEEEEEEEEASNSTKRGKRPQSRSKKPSKAKKAAKKTAKARVAASKTGSSAQSKLAASGSATPSAAGRSGDGAEAAAAATGSSSSSSSAAAVSPAAAASAAGPKASAKRSKPARVRGLGEVLLDEAARRNAAARVPEDLDAPDWLSARAAPSRYPPRRLCAASLLPARYRDPMSSLPFCDPAALEQLREQPPPWVRASAAAPFHEMIRTLELDRARRREQLQGALSAGGPDLGGGAAATVASQAVTGAPTSDVGADL